jgi:hypothetical protein
LPSGTLTVGDEAAGRVFRGMTAGQKRFRSRPTNRSVPGEQSMPVINVLVVADGIFSFAASDPLDNTFTIATFLNTLGNSRTPSISVDTAHRRGDSNATIKQPFNFATSIPDLSVYHVIWLLGYEGTNYGEQSGSLVFITDDEVAAIARFMTSGGGVFAAGDHDGLGSLMCGRIPRVRSMRKWFSIIDTDARIPAMAPRNWPGLGPDRADTLQPSHDSTWNFDNQSDDIPQTLTFPGGTVHPILQGPNGPITRFPDHMHEGEVITPWNMNDTLTFSGQSFVEYPTGFPNAEDPGGWQEKPVIVATGNVIAGHPTPVEGSACEQNNFTPDGSLTNGKTINVLCVYDGRNAETTQYFQSPGLGRVVTDSSFHRYLDLNLAGDPCGVGTKQQGFTTVAGSGVLADIKAYFINTVVWLANLPRLALKLDQTSVIGGIQNAIGTVQVAAIPPGGLQIHLTSDSPQAATVPAQVTILPDRSDSTYATFTITTSHVPSTVNVHISADAGGAKGSDSASLTVLKQQGQPAAVYGMTFDSDAIGFGDSALCTVTIVETPQPVDVQLSYVVSPPVMQGSVSGVPSSLSFAGGQTSRSFTIATSLTHPFRKFVTVTITATAGGATVQATLTVSVVVLKGGNGGTPKS